MRYLSIILLLLIMMSSLQSQTIVGGELNEDTVWSPENNPHLLTENLYVNSGVTLTILPGVEVQVSGAPCANADDFYDNFWYRNGNNVAKMIWVDGRIIAEGTQQDSIVFTRMQDDFDYYWGCIYITSEADLSVFEHCRLEYSAGMGILVGRIARGVLSVRNGKLRVNNSTLANNASCVYVRPITEAVEVTGNMFHNENVNPIY